MGKPLHSQGHLAGPLQRHNDLVADMEQCGQPSHNPLLCCMFDIVIGLLHKAGGTGAPVVSMHACMASRIGPSGSIDILRLHARFFGLPPSRPHAYLVLRKAAYYVQQPVRIPPPLARRMRSAQLLDLLHNDPQVHTPQPQAKRANWQQPSRIYMFSPFYRRMYAFFEIARESTSRVV